MRIIYLIIFFEGLYFQENFIRKTLINWNAELSLALELLDATAHELILNCRVKVLTGVKKVLMGAEELQQSSIARCFLLLL